MPLPALVNSDDVQDNRVQESEWYTQGVVRLIHTSLAWDICKQCRPRSGATECGV